MMKKNYLLGLFFTLTLLLPIGSARAVGSCFCLKDGAPSCQPLNQSSCSPLVSSPYGACTWNNNDTECAQHVAELLLPKSGTAAPTKSSPAEKSFEEALKPIRNDAQTVLNQFTTTSPQQIIGIAINGLMGFMGSIMFVLVIYAGILMMTAQGNTERIEHAKKIMVWATLGVAAMLMSYIVVNFVFTNL